MVTVDLQKKYIIEVFVSEYIVKHKYHQSYFKPMWSGNYLISALLNLYRFKKDRCSVKFLWR